MANKDDQEQMEATHELTDVIVFKVDLVKEPATGDEFLVVRSADGGDGMGRRAMSPEQYRAWAGSRKGVTIALDREAQGKAAEVMTEERQVPASDADTEKKREAQKKRATKYGVEALDGKGENLSYPSGDPTTESLYGDPVNLKYPLGYDDNKVSKARSNNARARFKQASGTYSKKKSKRVIHERIVKAQLKAGANPSFKADDPLDALLPTELKNKLKKGTATAERAETGGDEMPEVKEILERFGGTLDQLGEELGGIKERLGQIEERMNTEQPTEETPTPPEPEKPATEPETKPEPEAEKETPAEEPAAEPPAEPAAETPPADQALERVTKSVDDIGTTLKGVADIVTSMKSEVEGLTGRLTDVERSISTGNAKEPDDNDDPPPEHAERGKEPLFGSVFRGMPGMPVRNRK